MRQPLAAVRPDDERVGADLGREREDLLSGITRDGKRAHREARTPQRLCDGVEPLARTAGRILIDAPRPLG